MSFIDPDSPHIIGYDSHGEVVLLGAQDTDGLFIGYIDQNGLAWASRQERDVAVGAGRLHDAFLAWNKSGGVLGPEPDWEAILEAHNVLPQHQGEAFREFKEGLRMIRRLGGFTPPIQN